MLIIKLKIAKIMWANNNNNNIKYSIRNPYIAQMELKQFPPYKYDIRINLHFIIARRKFFTFHIFFFQILKEFPEELRGDISMHLHREILQLPIFESASQVRKRWHTI